MDELVKRLRAQAVYLPEKFSKNAELLDVLMKAAEAIEELQGRAKVLEKVADKWCEAVPKWIPVTERLPEQYVNVLVFLHSLDWNSIYYSIDHLMEDGQWWKASTSWKHEVTHWMPLPEPPKEGTQ